MTQKTVWITGASKGIGAALARHFADNAWRVIASARDEAALARACDQYPNMIPLVVDVCDHRRADHWFSDWCATRGIEQLDVFVANAGTAEYIDVDNMDIDKFQRVFDLNVIGTVRSVKWALTMLPRRGQLVFVSSLATFLPFTRAQAYAASKAAIDSVADSLQTDLLARGIDVSVIKPGFIKTPLTDKNDFDMPFILTPEQAAPRMYRAIIKRTVMFHFPKRMWGLLWLLRCLPKRLQQRLMAQK